MSFYVERTRETGELAYIGPIRSARQAEKERQAWEDYGQSARVLESTPETRRTVNAWQRAMDVRHGRR